MSESLNGLSTSGGRTIFICHIIFSVLAYVALALRFWAVKIRDRALEAHDYLILIAAVSPPRREDRSLRSLQTLDG